MADGEEPVSEQAGGSTPPPGLGIPEFGAPASGPAGPSQAQPEVVSGYGAPQPAPRRRRGMSASRWILVGILALAALGWVVTQVRHARATPKDKLACSSTLTALANPTTGMPAMLHDLDFADDKTLLGARGDMQTNIAQRNLAGLGQDLNTVIHRCNQISSEFKSGFQTFCNTHPGYCKETFHIGPF